MCKMQELIRNAEITLYAFEMEVHIMPTKHHLVSNVQYFVLTGEYDHCPINLRYQ